MSAGRGVGGAPPPRAAWPGPPGPPGPRRGSPLRELPTRERTRLIRALRRGDPIPPAQVDLARRFAEALVPRCTVMMWVYAVAAVLQGTAVVFLGVWSAQRHSLDPLALILLSVLPLMSLAGTIYFAVSRVRFAQVRRALAGREHF